MTPTPEILLFLAALVLTLAAGAVFVFALLRDERRHEATPPSRPTPPDAERDSMDGPKEPRR